MSYYFSKTLAVPFDEAVKRTTEALKRESFGNHHRDRREAHAEVQDRRRLSQLSYFRRVQSKARA